MSTFKTSWIIIKKSQINEKQEMIVIFSKDFGKIIVFSKILKKEKMLDLGTICNFEAQVKNDQSGTNMKNISILHQFEYTTWSYEMIMEFMELLKILYDSCPKWIPNNEIFEIFETLRYISLSHEKFLFAKLKLSEILGMLDQPIIGCENICNFIAQNSPKECLKLTGLSPTQIQKIQYFFEKSKT